MSKKESPQEIAAKRFEIISPLLDPNLDADMFCATKKKTKQHRHPAYPTVPLEGGTNATKKLALPDWSLKRQSQSSQLQNFQRISRKS